MEDKETNFIRSNSSIASTTEQSNLNVNFPWSSRSGDAEHECQAGYIFHKYNSLLILRTPCFIDCFKDWMSTSKMSLPGVTKTIQHHYSCSWDKINEAMLIQHGLLPITSDVSGLCSFYGEYN